MLVIAQGADILATIVAMSVAPGEYEQTPVAYLVLGESVAVGDLLGFGIGFVVVVALLVELSVLELRRRSDSAWLPVAVRLTVYGSLAGLSFLNAFWNVQLVVENLDLSNVYAVVA